VILFPTVPAEIIRFQERVYAIEGESASIICGVNGNPSIDNMAVWSRPGFDMSKTKQVYKGSESQIVIYDLERTDSGKFTCTADNHVGEPQSKEANLVVKCKFRKKLGGGSNNLMLGIKIGAKVQRYI
jgi:hypothetical protein